MANILIRRASLVEGRFSIRETNGTVTGIGMFSHTEITPVPSFGDRLDQFLDSFGYQDHTLLQLASGWDKCQSDRDFVTMMAQYGMNEAEASWFWEEMFISGGRRGDRNRPRMERIIV